MANPKGNPQNLKPLGRPKGCPNKFTTFKNSLIKAWEETDGDERLREWMLDPKNMSDVVNVMAKLLPKTIEGVGEGGTIVVRINNEAKTKSESNIG